MEKEELMLHVGLDLSRRGVDVCLISVQVREPAFHDPPLPADARAVFGPAARDHRLDPARP